MFTCAEIGEPLSLGAVTTRKLGLSIRVTTIRLCACINGTLGTVRYWS